MHYPFSEIYGNPSLRTGHFGVTYRGVNFVKCPFDYVTYQMLINDIQPDLIIEIGTAFGGGALYFADILDKLGKGIVHTIDIVKKDYDFKVTNHNRIKTFFDGYEGYDLNNTIGFNNILIIDDGSHVYDDVKKAFIKFNKLVSLNSYYIIEDGVIDNLGNNEYFNGGPSRFINELTDGDFIIDYKWCDFFGKNATFNPKGYLKKVI